MKNKKGFTLVELVIVIAVIAILSAVLLPTFAGILERAKNTANLQQLTSARNEIFSSNSQFESLNDLNGYVFKIDDKFYSINNGNISVSTEYTDINITDSHEISSITTSNSNIQIYQPIETTNPVETIGYKSTFYIDEVNKTATMQKNFDDSANIVVPSYIGNKQGTEELVIYFTDFYYIENLFMETNSPMTIYYDTDYSKSVYIETYDDIFNCYEELESYLDFKVVCEIPTYTNEEIYKVIEIDRFCFNDKTNLETISLPDTLLHITKYNFDGCDKLVYNTHEDYPGNYLGNENNPYMCFINIDETVSSITFHPDCKVISYYVFYNNTSLTSVQLPNDLKVINCQAFFNCSSLTSMVIPESVIYIGPGTFYNCKKLKTINIPKNITIIEHDLFTNCYELNGIEIPSGVTHLGDSAFENCNALTNIQIPSGVDYIGSYCFFGTKITNIIIPNGVTTLYAKTFGNCTQLSQISIPLSITHLREDPFYNCNALTYTIIDSCKYIKYADSDSLILLEVIDDTETTITISEKCKVIGYGVAMNNDNLETLYISEGVEYTSFSSFENCSNLKNVYLPSTLKSLHHGTFENCSSLTTITIKEGLTFIGNDCFRNCSNLTSVYLPKSLKHIGWSAFNGCTKLQSVNYAGSETDRNNIVFDSSGDIISKEWIYNSTID